MIPTTVGFLVRRGHGNGAAHVWTGYDTACRMYSTGGLKHEKYVFCLDRGQRRVCANCINLLGHDPAWEMESTLKPGVMFDEPPRS